MKICFINNLYKPYVKGGAEKVVEMTAQGLQERGHEVFVITAAPLKRHELPESHPNDSNVGIYKIWSPNLIFYGNLGQLSVPLRLLWHFVDMFNFIAAWKVRKIIKREKPDVIFLHNLKGLSYLIPKFLRGENIVLVSHDVQLAEPSGIIFYYKSCLLRSNLDRARSVGCICGTGWARSASGASGPADCTSGSEHEGGSTSAALYAKINRFLFSDIKKVISPSKWLLDFYNSHRFFKNATKVVLHNPIIIEPKALSRAQSALRAQNEIKKLLFVGQLEESKGILFLINTLKSYKPQAANYKLIIVGDGSRRDEVEKLIAGDKKFKYLEKLDGKELQKIYEEADYTIVPSLAQENCPTVILESFAAGTPVIASRTGGISELVLTEDVVQISADRTKSVISGLEMPRQQNGFLFSPGDALELEKILLNLPKAGWQKLSDGARASAKIYSLDKYINFLLSFSHEEDK